MLALFAIWVLLSGLDDLFLDLAFLYRWLVTVCLERRRIRILTVVDVFTRECLSTEADMSLNARKVTAILQRIRQHRDLPKVITVDNGVAYSSRSLTVKPGSRVCWQNVGSTVHSVTSDPVVDSVVDDTTWHLDGQLNPELVVLYSQFNKLGADYRYHCRYHQSSGMTGVIQVR